MNAADEADGGDADGQPVVVALAPDRVDAGQEGAEKQQIGQQAAFTVLVTLEKEAAPASPSGKRILSAAVAAG